VIALAGILDNPMAVSTQPAAARQIRDGLAELRKLNLTRLGRSNGILLRWAVTLSTAAPTQKTTGSGQTNASTAECEAAMTGSSLGRWPLSRRAFLATSIAAGAALTACGRSTGPLKAHPTVVRPIGSLYGYNEFDLAPLVTNAIFDDFDGPSGSAVNSSLWLVETVNMGGIQVYTTGTTNVYLDGESHCVIKLNNVGGYGGAWYGGEFTSRTKFNMQYGTFATSVKCIPCHWCFSSAWWFLGCQSDGFPEIDILQIADSAVTEANYLDAFASIPNPGPTTTSGQGRGQGSPTILPQLIGAGGDHLATPTPDFTTEFHTFWMQKTPTQIVCGYDEVTCATWTEANVPKGYTWYSLTTPQYAIYSAGTDHSIGYLGPPAAAPVQTSPYSWPPADSTPTPLGPFYMYIDWFSYQPLVDGVAPLVPKY
jgi:hypothetical protein